jgi:hypothetical protein
MVAFQICPRGWADPFARVKARDEYKLFLWDFKIPTAVLSQKYKPPIFYHQQA